MEGLHGDGDVKTAVVTGGGSGIGLAVARRLRADGLDVATIDLQPSDADLSFTADVTDRSQIDSALSAIHDRLGPVTVLVTAAGLLNCPTAFPSVRVYILDVFKLFAKVFRGAGKVSRNCVFSSHNFGDNYNSRGRPLAVELDYICHTLNHDYATAPFPPEPLLILCQLASARRFAAVFDFEKVGVPELSHGSVREAFPNGRSRPGGPT